jgi:hypothetical protein
VYPECAGAKNMPAMPKLHLKYIMHQRSIRHGSYNLNPPLQVRLEKRIKQANKAFLEIIPEEP